MRRRPVHLARGETVVKLYYYYMHYYLIQILSSVWYLYYLFKPTPEKESKIAHKSVEKITNLRSKTHENYIKTVQIEAIKEVK